MKLNHTLYGPALSAYTKMKAAQIMTVYNSFNLHFFNVKNVPKCIFLILWSGQFWFDFQWSCCQQRWFTFTTPGASFEPPLVGHWKSRCSFRSIFLCDSAIWNSVLELLESRNTDLASTKCRLLLYLSLVEDGQHQFLSLKNVHILLHVFFSPLACWVSVSIYDWVNLCWFCNR